MNHVLHIPTGLGDPTLWVIVALLLFLGLVVYLGAPAMLTKALDARAAKIAQELEDAARMREEAQELLASYQRRQRGAEKEAAGIIDQARRDAEALGKEMRAALREQLERRAVMAERKIAQAETDALADVRRRAADLAAAAAEVVLRKQIDADAQNRLVDEGVTELSSRFS